MRQYTETYHCLQMAKGRCVFAKPSGDIYRDAQLLAHNGRIEEAIQAAEEATIKANGNMFGVRFRVVTKTETISFNGVPADHIE